MQAHSFVNTYRAKSDEELLRLAAQPEQLTPEAVTALMAELGKRRLSAGTPPAETPKRLSVALNAISKWEASQNARALIAEVLQTYHAHFWLFIKLTAPAVLFGYLAISGAHNEARQIIRGLREQRIATNVTVLLGVSLIRICGYSASWLVSWFSFAAICSAVSRMKRNIAPNILECVSDVTDRMGLFLRVSLLLLLTLGVLLTIANMLASGVLFGFYRLHWRLPSLWYWILPYALNSLALLAQSRFSLALPAVILDELPIGRAMFLSDELTEGKWLSLTALLSKSVIGGYIAWTLPFWIRYWLWGTVQLPYWVAVAASIAGVTFVEPTMFIGFALMYLNAKPRHELAGVIPAVQTAHG